jgi:hypothetical protein
MGDGRVTEMHPRARHSTRLAAGTALSALVMAVLASPASAHGAEFAEAPPRSLAHLLTQWDHLAVLVLALLFVGALVATLRGARNQAD